MTRKLNCVLLIDDSEHDNFFHSRIIRRYGCAERVVAIEDAREALRRLSAPDDESFARPDLIFLDINMPGMDGWEFLEAYGKLDAGLRGSIIVVMLTTSLNPLDRQRAEAIPDVASFTTKPLGDMVLDGIMGEFFSNAG